MDDILPQNSSPRAHLSAQQELRHFLYAVLSAVAERLSLIPPHLISHNMIGVWMCQMKNKFK